VQTAVSMMLCSSHVAVALPQMHCATVWIVVDSCRQDCRPQATAVLVQRNTLGFVALQQLAAHFTPLHPKRNCSTAHVTVCTPIHSLTNTLV
jgi:hypothetical protein